MKVAAHAATQPGAGLALVTAGINFPDPLTWAGTAIIIGAGLYVLHRERRPGVA